MHQVYILHWNSAERCLATVRRFCEQELSLQITVIDNGSHAGEVAALRAGLPDGTRLVQHPHNRGWGGGFNPLLREWLTTDRSDGHVFLSAHDALPEPDCLPRLARALEDHPEIGWVSPEYGAPDLPRYEPLRGVALQRAQPRPAGTVECFPFVHGTLMGARAECLAAAGGFDERFFAYGDELEICLRANRRGWATAIVWGARVVNPGTGTPSPLMAYLWTRNLLLLSRLYGGRRTAMARASAVAATTAWFWLTRRPRQSLSSPEARWRGLVDFLRGRFGPPAPALVARLRSL